MRDRFCVTKGSRAGVDYSAVLCGVLICLVLSSGNFFPCSRCWAVTSKVVRHSSGVDFLNGRTEDVVVGSKGTVQLGWAWKALVKEFEDVWSINSVVVSAGTVYIGTSPNGGVYKYSLSKLTKIYPRGPIGGRSIEPVRRPNDVSELDEPNKVGTKEDGVLRDITSEGRERYLSNEHIFAMATDVAGRLLVGISGERCRLCRLEGEGLKEIFQPNEAKYIFAITIDESGNIYLGTGPEGKVYRLDSLGREAHLVYESRDKNILSLVIGDRGFVYAGTDDRGLIYKINPRTKTAAVLYDSDQPEITSLLFLGDGDLYAAATSAKLKQAESQFAKQLFVGRPGGKPTGQAGNVGDEGGLKLEIANTKKEGGDKAPAQPKPAVKRAKPGKASYIYKITGEGFVTDVFSESVVLFCLAEQKKTLLVGTGNSAKLFSVDPASEQEAIIYEDKEASQITAITVSGQDVYLGTANPAKLIRLSEVFAAKGIYSSKLIDASAPARWGKLQIEADIPKGCKILAASRSGNVKDVNDPTFSDWTDLVEVTGPMQLGCPLGRFCQYQLVLQSEDGQISPLVREVMVAYTIPNLKPKVESISVDHIEAPGKTGVFKLSYKAADGNGDKLIYKIDFRKVGRDNWIELKDEVEADNFEWNGKTVEDGRYEVKVTASDERSNTPATKLAGSRVSDPVVVDNKGPVVEKRSIEKYGEKVTLKLKTVDELSAIGKLDYTVDSNADWIGAVPDDMVYDTTQEDITIVIEDLQAGEHVIAVRVSDNVGNTTYKTFEVSLAVM